MGNKLIYPRCPVCEFEYAEGWRRHSHLGFSEEELDPLVDALRSLVRVNMAYRRRLERPAARAPSRKTAKRRQR